LSISKQFIYYLLGIFIPVGIWLLIAISGALSGIEQEAIRWRYLFRGELKSTAPIHFVDLDAATISYMGDRPWDRREFGVLINALLDVGGARVVGLDIIFSKFGAGALLDVERARKGDAFLGQAIAAHPDRVVLAAGYTRVKSSFTNEMADLPFVRDGNYDPETNHFPEAPTYPIIQFDVGRLGLANVDESLSGGMIPYYVPAFVELNSPRYSLHLMDGLMRQKGYFMNEPVVQVDGDQVVLTDKDGFTTDALPLQHEMTLFSLGLETFLTAHGLDQSAVEIRPDLLTIHRDGTVFRQIPLVRQQSIAVNWFEGWDRSLDHGRDSMQMVLRQAHALAEAASAGDLAQVAELEQWFQRFRDKVIFVGPVDPQLKDLSPTPFNREPVPKVGLHANLYRMLEDQAYITRTGRTVNILIVCLLASLVSFLALGSGRLRFLAFICLLGYALIAFVVFAQFNWILPLVVPVSASLMAALSVVLIKLGSEEWQRRRIKALFGAYLAPNLVDEIIESKQDPQLGGTEAEITALFSDVEGFSSLSEELSPHQLVSLMNEYLGALTEVFQRDAGTLDKYIGDAIVTMFGMPIPVADHAARACRSAIEMQKCHAALRQKWADSGEWPESVLHMRTRIGLNSGMAVIGNMGSEMRFTYTMMGDTVNVAARCESGAKKYGVYTMVTANTLFAALDQGAALTYRQLDRIIVKGRRQPIEVYELWDPSVSQDLFARCKAAYEAALALYFDGDWAAALAGFEAAALLEPSQAFAPTTPSEYLAGRCRQFLESGGPQDWDGSFKMQKK
jgi:adenylate cyclase